MEETRIIKRVGNYSTSQANPEDCNICHNAKWATILINNVCLDCYLKNYVSLGTEMPNHLWGNCCGFFTDHRPEGLFCNECGIEMDKAIWNYLLKY